jgi:hypothetical protein
MNNVKHLYLGIVITFIITYGCIMYIQAGFSVTLIICGSMIGGLIVWLKTTFNKPVEPKKILPVYLLTLSFFTLHVMEEYIGDFWVRIRALMHTSWSEHDFILVICFLGPMVWILGSIGIYFRNPLGNFLMWFIFVGMILGEPSHILIFPFLEGGRYHYFPGMWTALFPMIPAIYGIYLVLMEVKKSKVEGKAGL